MSTVALTTATAAVASTKNASSCRTRHFQGSLPSGGHGKVLGREKAKNLGTVSSKQFARGRSAIMDDNETTKNSHLSRSRAERKDENRPTTDDNLTKEGSLARNRDKCPAPATRSRRRRSSSSGSKSSDKGTTQLTATGSILRPIMSGSCVVPCENDTHSHGRGADRTVSFGQDECVLFYAKRRLLSGGRCQGYEESWGLGHRDKKKSKKTRGGKKKSKRHKHRSAAQTGGTRSTLFSDTGTTSTDGTTTVTGTVTTGTCTVSESTLGVTNSCVVPGKDPQGPPAANVVVTIVNEKDKQDKDDCNIS
ncbi:hypothetical protein BIW11_10520 [Tropilaelaps mercedesae]|uniref:Uncharacterized protein n=1 Tax=Tropilaelaps mercedesae TaxID=418985 RepID=A0A1V9XFN2_9ACAR|nr:hypothetical protein BIW11_10520 [Tropilaelaps mercedesae]